MRIIIYTHYVHSLIAYFDRPNFKSILFFFSIIIYLLCQNKCFVIFYKFEQTCSNVQFIPSPIGEGILATVVKIPILFIFFLHI